MAEKKLIKVVFYYKDGISKYLSGKELKKWEKSCMAAATLQYAHSGKFGFEDVKYKEVNQMIAPLDWEEIYRKGECEIGDLTEVIVKKLNEVIEQINF